jgi:hypothetical protein
VFLIFESFSISLSPRDEKIIPVLGGRGMKGEREIKEFLELGRERELQEEMRDGF